MEIDKKNDWQAIANGYDEVADDIWEGGWLYSDSMRLLKDIGGDVLDIGCGQGVFLSMVEEKFPNVTSISGCDISPELVRRSKKRLSGANFRVENALTLESFDDESFDHVFMICSLEHMIEHQKALHSAYRVIRPGGSISISVPNKNWVLYERWKRNHVQFQPVDDYWFEPDELINYIETAGFTVDHVLGGWAILRGNWFHAFENIAADIYPPLRRKMKNIGIRALKSPKI